MGERKDRTERAELIVRTFAHRSQNKWGGNARRRAIVHHNYGLPDVQELQDFDKPKAKDKEELT